MALEIVDRYDGSVLIVQPFGRIDTTTAKTLEEHLSSHIEHGQTQIVLDFEKVDYVSSLGLRVMLIIAKKLMPAKRSLALCNLSDDVNNIFQISGFGKVLAIKEKVPDAVSAVAA